MAYFKTKAEWADAKAKELEDTAHRIHNEYVAGTKVRQKYQATARCHEQALRFRRMAESFRKRGL